MGVSFFIKSKVKGSTSIHCSVNFKGIKRFILLVPNIKIESKDWENGWIKTGRGRQANSYIETALNDFKSKIEGFYHEYVKVKKLLPVEEDFKRYLKSNNGLNEFFDPNDVFDILPRFQRIVDRREDGTELNKGKFFAKGTVDNYKSTLEKLKEYQEKKHGVITNLDIIKKEFIEGFQVYLTKVDDKRLNSIGNRMKILKALIEVLYNEDVLPINPFKKYKIPISREDSISIALDENELDEMFELDLSDDSRLENVRDQFLILCWTGLRISDFSSFNDIPKDNDIITVTNEKTGGVAQIPLFPKAKLIFDKYEGRFPKQISEQKMRDYIKEIGQKIKGLNRSIEVTYTKGGKRIREIKKRHQLISLHTGRRTLCTFLKITIGLPSETCMIISGHKSHRDFERYIKLNKSIELNQAVETVKNWEKMKKERKEIEKNSLDVVLLPKLLPSEV